MSFATRIFQLVDSGIRVGEEEDFGIFTIILSLFQISFSHEGGTSFMEFMLLGKRERKKKRDPSDGERDI